MMAFPFPHALAVVVDVMEHGALTHPDDHWRSYV
jgi:hypothetical protein